jgi:CNP1-like family protein
LKQAWLLAAAALTACAGPADERSDWERKHAQKIAPDEAVALPAYPRKDQLIEFFVAATSEFRFYVDAASISVAKEVVHYALVARSKAGAENVTFEGMRCPTGEVRIYAVGRDGSWVGRPGEWRPIQPRSFERWHNALYREYFCPSTQTIASREEAVAALRTGGVR